MLKKNLSKADFRQTPNRICLAGLILLSFNVCSADENNFDEGWKFIQQDVKNAQREDFSDTDWRTLDLPHDWTVEGKFDRKNRTTDRCGYLPTGIGWYRKTIDVPAHWKDKHVAIRFDGVFRNSTVWVNGKKLGHRPYGWISFEYDISQFANSDDSITVAVRVDNSMQHAARWYTGSGIYGHTWIKVRDPVHIPSDGVWVRTEGSAVTIDTEVTNHSASDAQRTVKTTILDATGNTVVTADAVLKVGHGKTESLSQKLTIADPNRWSPDNPYLYRAVSEVISDAKVIDRVETRFGVRDIQWVPGKGMLLNGQVTKLRGVCQHQHAGALGAAVPKKIIRFRVEQMKAMGCNSIRAAHNPHTPEFYDICDELGMIVMDEFVDGWGQKARADYGAQAFDDWWKRDLTDWIKRDRNHACVFLWSVGNETRGQIGKELVARCHEIDPTRPVTSGSSEEQFMDILGMNGGSEGVGWFENNMPTDRVFIGTENTHTWQTRGYYRTQTWYRDGKMSVATDIPDLTEQEIFTYDWTVNDRRSNRKQFYKSSYDNATVRSPARRAIAQIRDYPNNAGMYRWTGHDYLGEAGLASGAWPFKLFSGGTCDLANFEKDLYYLYQSQWTTQPMVHMLPHWTHPTMKPGTKIPVWVYSNCEQVELFLNGQSLGKQQPGRQWQKMQCQWMVGWTPGTLKAIGYNAGNQVAEKTFRTADEPARLALSIDGRPLAETGKDLAQVRTSVLDSKGEFYPYGENRVYFGLNGPARLKALDNGQPNDVEPFYGTSDRNAFFGLARAYVESNKNDGQIGLIAGSILGDKRLTVSKMVHIDVQQIALRGNPTAIEPEIFYTIDGSTPTTHSTKYEGSFQAKLGTTVKALVTIGGKPRLRMAERFADDVGLVWSGGGLDSDFGGDQAEDAEFAGAKVSTEGKNYNGSGFLDLNKNKGAYVEWYQENDGAEKNANLVVRYSGNFKGKQPLKLQLNVNGGRTKKVLTLPPARNSGRQWRTTSTPITLQRGANTIRLIAIDNRAPLIDEIEIK
jgi:beta-galactosidase